MKKTILIMLIVAALLLTSCGPKCPTCPGSGAWSSCDENAVKTRTNYRCSESSNFECESYTEEDQCATEIRVAGRTGLSEVLITPTIEKTVSGVITVELSKAPAEAKGVIFMIQKGTVEMESGMGENSHMDSDAGDGWSVLYDTTEFENGLYEVAAVIGTDFGGNTPPLDAVVAQIVISN